MMLVINDVNILQVLHFETEVKNRCLNLARDIYPDAEPKTVNPKLRGMKFYLERITAIIKNNQCSSEELEKIRKNAVIGMEAYIELAKNLDAHNIDQEFIKRIIDFTGMELDLNIFQETRGENQ